MSPSASFSRVASTTIFPPLPFSTAAGSAVNLIANGGFPITPLALSGGGGVGGELDWDRRLLDPPPRPLVTPLRGGVRPPAEVRLHCVRQRALPRDRAAGGGRGSVQLERVPAGLCAIFHKQ